MAGCHVAKTIFVDPRSVARERIGPSKAQW